MCGSIVWNVGDQDAVREFLQRLVPLTDARLLCRQGVVSPVKTLKREYTRAVPFVPVRRYQSHILTQLRQTSAMGILSLWRLGDINEETKSVRHKLRDVLLQFSDDGHWENHMALALSAHADEEWDSAVKYYERALRAVGGDPQFAPEPGIDGLQSEIHGQLGKAKRHEELI